MTIIVTDTGFAKAEPSTYVALNTVPANADTASLAVDIPSDADLSTLAAHVASFAAVRVDFPSFADGRGFTIAKRLRELGYSGPLRARGHVIADQYAMARRSGFDEVEISDDLAARQPEDQWLARADWQDHDYQTRLKRRA